MSTSLHLTLAVRHYPEDQYYNVSDIDFGSFIGGLTEEPIRLANVGEDGKLRIEVERTHEWELVFSLVVTGSVLFGKAIVESFGKRLGEWMADQVEKRLRTDSKHVEIRGDDGRIVKVDPDNVSPDARAVYMEMIEKAAMHGATVVILFPSD